MNTKTKLRVVSQTSIRGTQDAGTSSIRRMFRVDPASGETSKLGRDPKNLLNDTGRGIRQCFTLADVPPGTILLEERFVGLLRRTASVEYTLFVYDGVSIHLVGEPAPYSHRNTHVNHNGIHLYFDTTEAEADVTAEHVTTDNGTNVVLTYSKGSDSAFVLGDDCPETDAKVGEFAAVMAASRGQIVTRIQRVK